METCGSASVCGLVCANCWRVHICVMSEGVHVVRLIEGEVRGQGWGSLPAASESCSCFRLFSPLTSCPPPTPASSLPAPPPPPPLWKTLWGGGLHNVHGRRPTWHADAEDQSSWGSVTRWPPASYLIFCLVSFELFWRVGFKEVHSFCRRWLVIYSWKSIHSFYSFCVFLSFSFTFLHPGLSGAAEK